MASGLTAAEIKKEYIKIFTALLVFTALTIIAAFLDIGGKGSSLGLIVGLIIAALKTTMVIYIFMHIKFDSPYLRVFVVVPLFFFAVLASALYFLGL